MKRRAQFWLLCHVHVCLVRLSEEENFVLQCALLLPTGSQSCCAPTPPSNCLLLNDTWPQDVSFCIIDIAVVICWCQSTLKHAQMSAGSAGGVQHVRGHGSSQALTAA